MFLLKNYKAIVHILAILITFGMNFLINKEALYSPLYCFFMLAVCFFVSNFAIKFVGLDKTVEDEIKKNQK
jgi:ABC-type polysaccharide/polyol phosphate export permease